MDHMITNLVLWFDHNLMFYVQHLDPVQLRIKFVFLPYQRKMMIKAFQLWQEGHQKMLFS